MAINLLPTFIPNLSSEKTSSCQIKEKNSCLKGLAWLELPQSYLNICH